MNLHTGWMRRALQLAEKGQGFVHPNPMVGAVILRGRRVVGQGYHRAFGGNHAEVEALRQAGSRARGATLYVNLEPCAHWGKTPPCVEAIKKEGIRHVVAAVQDPHPLVSGRGFAFLKKSHIRITKGILREEAVELNRAFITWVRERRPYVTLKAATSLDGKIATSKGESQWITGPPARRMTHHWRSHVDATAVGIDTVLKDNPSLTTHGNGRNPKRIIFDSVLRVPLRSHILDRQAPTWILTTPKAPPQKLKALEKKGIHTFVVAPNPQGQVSIPESMRLLAKEGIVHLLVEGGGRLHASFLETGKADEVLWFIAPMIIGGANAKTAVEGQGIQRLKEAWRLQEVAIDKIGQDICIRGKIHKLCLPESFNRLEKL